MRRTLLLASALACSALSLSAQGRPYTEGNVTNVVYVRSKPGKFIEFMKYLQGPYKTQMEALKKEGIIVSYAIYSSPPRDPEDWNLVLTTVYRNMAALDGLVDRTDPIATRLIGPQETRDQQAIDREAMRTIIGSRLVRELQLR